MVVLLSSGAASVPTQGEDLSFNQLLAYKMIKLK